MKHSLTHYLKLGASAVIIVFAVLAINMIFASTSSPMTGYPNGNISPFINDGPTPQTKYGNLKVGTNTNPGLTNEAFGVYSGVANLAGGISVKPPPTVPTPTVAYINTDTYIGYQGSGATNNTQSVGTPAKLEVWGDVKIAGNITDSSLVNTTGNKTVCVTRDGVIQLCPTAPTPTGTGGGTVGNIPPTLTGASVSRTASVRFTPCHDSELDTFLATRTGGSGTISYQWQVASSTSSTTPSNYSNVGTNSSTFTLNLPYYVSGSRTNYAVRVRITDSGSGPIQGNTVTSSPFYTHNELNPGNSISPACPV